MKIKIEVNVDNKLLNRQDITFTVEHVGESTPPRLDVRAKLSALLNCKEDQLYIVELGGKYGVGTSKGLARLYPSKEAALKQELKHIIKRHEKKGAAEEKPKAAEKPRAEEKPKPPIKEEPSPKAGKSPTHEKTSEKEK